VAEGSTEGGRVKEAGNDFAAHPQLTADKISRVGMLTVRVALGISFVLLLLLMAMPGRETARLRFIPGLGLWGGLPISVILFVSGFFRTNRRQSILTMVFAAMAGLAWVFVAFSSMALMWRE
jgi:hypothetical protein